MKLSRLDLLAPFAALACGSATVNPPAPKPDPNAPEPEPVAVCRQPNAAALDAPWFTEITSEVGLAKTDALEPLGVGVVAADLDGDGWQDFFTASSALPSAKRTQFLFMNRPDPKDPHKRVFVDALEDSGLLATRAGGNDRQISSLSFADIDNDGDLDAVGCGGDIDTHLRDGCAAFLNDGKGHFTLAPEGGDLETDVYSSGSAAVLDWDKEGVLDYWPATIGKWQYGPAPTSRMRFFKGNGDGTFADASQDVGLPSTLVGYGDYRMMFGMTSCDIDLDGDRDVLVGEYGVEVGMNHVYRNDNGVFTDIGKQLGIAKGPPGQGGFTFGITCGDLDDDGDVDLYTSELHHAWYPKTDSSEPLINDGKGNFVRVGRAALGTDRPHIGDAWTEGDAQTQFVDFDLDGRKDVYVVSVNYPQQSAIDPDWTHDWVYRQKADGTFEDVTKKTPFWDQKLQSLGDAAVFDIDGDGDLDIVTGTATYNSEYLGLTNALHVFRNDVGNGGNLARIKITGKGAGGSNASGIGARVEVTAGGRTQHQEVLGPWNSTQSDVTLTFGLGASCTIDKIVVHWPDAANTVTTYTNVPANYAIEIREGRSDLRYRNFDGTKPQPR